MIKKIFFLVFSACLGLQISLVSATDEPLVFSDIQQEHRYKKLIEELRCLVCQNQSLADSHADLAQDLRQEVYNMLVQGKNNEEIINYLVQRYGDFVLYRPPFRKSTLLLWLSPVIFLLIGAVVLFFLIRKQTPQPLNEDQQNYASQLLSEEDTENKI